jgi:Flp pilus assembly secretin CpaC
VRVASLLLLFGSLLGSMPPVLARADEAQAPAPSVVDPFDGSWVEADGKTRFIYRPRFVPASELMAGAKSINLGPVDVAFEGVRSRLLLTGARPRIDDALAALAFLDVATPEVLVDIVVVETACRSRVETGGHTLFDRTGGPDTFFRSFRHDFEPEAWLRSQLVGDRPFEGGSVVLGDSSSSGAFAGTVEAVLRGLAHDGASDIVARPSLVCTEGVPAHVESALALPGLMFQRDPAYDRTSNVETRRAISEKAGVMLDVTAEFVGSGGARLRIHPWVRRVAAPEAEAGPLSLPVLAISELVTTIHVADGETVVVGGVQGRRRVRDRNGLPLLDRLPALDGAISARFADDEVTDLQVLVRVRILTPGRSPPRYVPPGESGRLDKLARTSPPGHSR